MVQPQNESSRANVVDQQKSSSYCLAKITKVFQLSGCSNFLSGMYLKNLNLLSLFFLARYDGNVLYPNYFCLKFVRGKLPRQ
ncbi:hypothetical protein LIER_06146 [Lithospermum erythrorhizon]|uniref:Uncharacterized protein n=1 Tax=Lithospermum erythrorhizon TaxID=34254 RepID=A0AAV3P7W0_LITER